MKELTQICLHTRNPRALSARIWSIENIFKIGVFFIANPRKTLQYNDSELRKQSSRTY